MFYDTLWITAPAQLGNQGVNHLQTNWHLLKPLDLMSVCQFAWLSINRSEIAFLQICCMIKSIKPDFEFEFYDVD